MPVIAILGSTSDHGGDMMTASGYNVLAEGVPVAVNGDLHECPIPFHGITPVFTANNVLINGEIVLTVGAIAGCGAMLITGVPTILVE